MIGITHLIEGGIDMMIVMAAGGRGGARVEIETDGGEKGVPKDTMIIMIGMKDNTNVPLVGEGGREAEVTVSIEMIQEEGVVLEEMIMEITEVVIIETACERRIIINMMTGSSLRNKPHQPWRRHPKVTPILPRRKDMD